MTDAHYWEKIWTAHPDMRVNHFARRACRRIRANHLLTLLDVGCGAGQDSRYFAQQGLQVTALDLAAANLERLHRLDNRIICLNRDVCQLDFEEQSYDVIYAHLSLQYFDDGQTRQIFLAIYRTLKTGGLFFVKCKSTDDPLFGEGEKVGENMYFKGHLRHFFSKEYMADILGPFQVLSLRRTSSVYGRTRSSFIEAVATR
jgi:SAM-dependent methyltransferase